MAETEHGMTTEELAAIKARVTAASDGPWRQCPCGKCGLVWQVSYADTPIATSDAHEPEGGGEPWPLEAIRANGAFIAAARTDVPALLAEVERLQRALAQRSTAP
jgi:hypothetical protein